MKDLLVTSIAHRPGRTLASIAGIALGILLVVLTVGLIRGQLRARGERDANVGAELLVSRRDQIGIALTSLPMTLPLETVEQIRAVEGVRAATAIGQYLEMKGESGLGLRQLDGVQFEEYTAATGIEVIDGSPLPTEGDYVLIDVRYAGDHRLRPGDALTLFDRPFRVQGIYRPETGARMMVPLATLQSELGREGYGSMILVRVVDPSRQEEVARRILALSPDWRVLFSRDLPSLFAEGYGSLTLFLNLVTALASVVSLLIISLTMYTTVTERTRQIGILKSLGASRAYIVGIFLQETGLLCVLGISTGLLLSAVIRLILIHGIGLTLTWEIDYIAYAILGGGASGLLGGLYPAWRAARLDPVEALQYE